MQIDSLKVVHDTIVIYKDSAVALDLLNQTREFYDSSWSKLLWVIGIIGVFIPGGLAWLSNYRYVNDKKELKELQEEIKKLKEGTENTIKEYQSMIKSFSNSYDKYIPILDVLKRKEDRKIQIEQEERAKGDTEAQITSRIITRWLEEGLL